MRNVSKSATFLATESVNSAPFRRGETEVQMFWQGKAQNSSPILRCTFLARRSAKLIANFSAKMVTSLPSFSLSPLSLSLCISLSLSLSLSHRMYLTHNIGSASPLPIIMWTLNYPLKLTELFPACKCCHSVKQIFCTATNAVGTRVSCWNSRLLSLTCFGALLRRFRYMGPVSLYHFQLRMFGVRGLISVVCYEYYYLIIGWRYTRLTDCPDEKLQRRQPIKFSIEGKQFFVHCFAAAARPAQKIHRQENNAGHQVYVWRTAWKVNRMYMCVHGWVCASMCVYVYKHRRTWLQFGLHTLA